MNFEEIATVFRCGGEDLLVGIASVPVEPRARGVLVIVGGPQYRVGSHRQFTLLARRLAAAGYPVFRFDYRGMGDASGDYVTFKEIAGDIRAAIDTFQALCPEVREVVLWGLCGAASASMIYAPDDKRVAGIIALNPWVRDNASFAKTRVRHYYGSKLLRRRLWIRLAKGDVAVGSALRAFVGTLRNALAHAPASRSGAKNTYQFRMAQGLALFSGPTLLILSGNDLTAKEFLAHASGSADWRTILDRPSVTRCDFPGFNHTFSTREQRCKVEDATLRWLEAS